MNFFEQAPIISIPSSPSNQSGSLGDRAREVLERRLGLIQRLALLFSLAAAGGGISYLILSTLSDSMGLRLYGIGVLAEALVCLLTFWMARSGNSLARADWCSQILAGSLLLIIVAAQPIAGAGDVISGAFLLIPVVAGILGMGFTAVAINTVISALALVTTYSLEFIFKVYRPGLYLKDYALLSIILWLILIGVIASSLLVFVRRLTQAIALSDEQADKLRGMNTSLNRATEFGASLSQEVTSVTTELNATAVQQASGSQQQVAAVTEVTTSLEGLSDTANQIATNAAACAGAANRALVSATQVKDDSEMAHTSSREGEAAINELIKNVERVRNQIELLGQRLLYLTEQNHKATAMINLIDDISKETHLLALNAAIEAAAGVAVGDTHRNGTGTTYNNQGERFGVIAREVKNLSDRSRKATEEVRATITEMQGAVAAAVQVAEESKEDSIKTLSSSQIAGLVIRRLSTTVANSAVSAEQILIVVEEVNSLSDSIKLATSEQGNANQQILTTMRIISDVARQSAGAVSAISATITRVNSQLAELQTVLNHS